MDGWMRVGGFRRWLGDPPIALWPPDLSAQPGLRKWLSNLFAHFETYVAADRSPSYLLEPRQLLEPLLSIPRTFAALPQAAAAKEKPPV